MPINRRIFGTPITGKVREELERRQTDGGQIEFGESQVGKTYLTQHQEVSSRTPFVRMWTSLKLIDPGVYADATPKVINEAEIKARGGYQVLYDELKQKLMNDFAFKDPLGVEYQTAHIQNEKNEKGEIIKFIIREKGTRDKLDFARKVYMIGDKGYSQTYGEQKANESLTTTDNINDTDNKGILGKVFPQELKKNPLLKPEAGIKSLRVETTGELGTIKKTTVNFIVHNFYDFDKIFNKYFLKPGATVFVDYGWNTVKNLYEPAELIEQQDIELYLYGDKQSGDNVDGIVTKNASDFDVIVGLVSDYNAKILPNGSVECSVTLTSANSSILNFRPESDFTFRIKKMLTQGLLYYGVTSFLKDNEITDELGEYLNYNTDEADEKKQLIDRTNQEAITRFGKPVPDGEAIRQGVYIANEDLTDVYINWGLFEDLIMNTQFGFGQDKLDINKGNRFQVRMDSSESFTAYSVEKFKQQQVQLSNTNIPSPEWVYPEWWHIAAGKGRGKGYNFKEKKTPTTRVVQDENIEVFQDDINQNRIPIREIFIKIDLITDAFDNASSNNKSTVKTVLKEILSKLTDDSKELFEWDIINGNLDSQLQVVDRKFIDDANRKYYEDLSTEDEEKLFFNFKIMSPNSFVKDYNLEFKMPSTDMANYYALNALSYDNVMTRIKPRAKEALASQYKLAEGTQLGIIYEPDNGGYRAEQSLNDNEDADAFDVFSTVRQMVSSETREVNESFSKGSTVRKKTKSTSKKSKANDTKIDFTELENIITKNENFEKMANRVHAKEVLDYYSKEVEDAKKDKKVEDSVPMPYFLSMTIFGIGSIVPGDTFTVDYLPEEHLKNAYQQTIQVVHEINPSGWFTTLETQYRTKFIEVVNEEGVDKSNAKPIEPGYLRLSPRALQLLNLLNGHWHPEEGERFYGFHREEDPPSEFKLKYLLPLMTDVTIRLNQYEQETPIISGGTVTSTTPVMIKLDGQILTFTTPGESEKKDGKFEDQELNKLKGIFLQSAYAEFGTIYEGVDEKSEYYSKTPIRDFDSFTNETEWMKKYQDNPFSGNGVTNGILGDLSSGLGIDPHAKECLDAPFVFMDSRMYRRIVRTKKLPDGTKGTYAKKENLKNRTRVYPPAVEFKPNTTYEMLILSNGRYAIFDTSKFNSEVRLEFYKFLSKNGADVKRKTL